MNVTPQTTAPSSLTASPLSIIRFPELCALTGLSRATICRRLKDDPTFPKAVPLSDSTARGAAVGFVLGEVQAWVQARMNARGAA